jgi:DnaJ family protein C protein 3
MVAFLCEIIYIAFLVAPQLLLQRCRIAFDTHTGNLGSHTSDREKTKRVLTWCSILPQPRSDIVLCSPPHLDMRFLALTSLLTIVGTVYADAGGLYPPGLLPLINRANVLLSTGQFNEAVRIYSEAIDQSPADYLLYYKRATALFSLSRHASALDDFDKVLSLTSGSFDNAYLMKARIQTRDGNFQAAREALTMYVQAKGKTRAWEDASELDKDIEEGERVETKMEQERAAQLWNACVESASAALRVASHSIDIRSVRAECALASGDVESAVGDLT